MIDLKFNKVSKRYRVRQELPEGAARNAVVRKIQSLRMRTKDFWAIRDVSFEVKRGEAFGIIGHNGAGKSTILKLLANITAPTGGEITINGRLSALIEVGSGFHPELTGRENIYLNGSILGMQRREISEKLDRIVEFAGISQFVDTPVKRYSSGMYVRLGFSIAAHLDPDILLLDEVLAVGDASFQAKCLQRINELKEDGTTIVFISHDLGAVERVCDRVLLMQKGEVIADGLPQDVIAEYGRVAKHLTPPTARDNGSLESAGKAKITSLTVLDADGNNIAAARTGEPIKVRIEFEAYEPIAKTGFEVLFLTQDGSIHCDLKTDLDEEEINLETGAGAIEFFCPQIGFQPGLYHVEGGIKDNDWQYRCATLRVDPGKVVMGDFYMPHEWKVVNRDEGDNAADENLLAEQRVEIGA